MHTRSITQSGLLTAARVLYKQLKHISENHNAMIKMGPETDSTGLYCMYSCGTQGMVEDAGRMEGERRK